MVETHLKRVQDTRPLLGAILEWLEKKAKVGDSEVWRRLGVRLFDSSSYGAKEYEQLLVALFEIARNVYQLMVCLLPSMIA